MPHSVVRTKICGFTRPEDAAAAARLGADAVGLVFYSGSRRHISLQTAQDIAAVLPPFVSITALFVNESEAAVRAVLSALPVDVLQFHGDETPEFCRRFQRPYLKAVRVRSRDDVSAAVRDFADARAVLLDAWVDGAYGGTGHGFDWSLLPENLPPQRWILSGGLNPDNVAAALAQTGASAVDVSSGVERAPGIKCADKMAAFLAACRR